MSLIKLANGQKFEIEPFSGEHETIIDGRRRNGLTFIFKASEENFLTIEAAFLQKSNLENITVYYPDEKETATDEQLQGVAHKVYMGYTKLGEVLKTQILLESDISKPPVFGKQLSIEVGERYFDEE